MKINEAQKHTIRNQITLLEDPNYKPTPENRAIQASLLRTVLDDVYEANGMERIGKSR